MVEETESLGPVCAHTGRQSPRGPCYEKAVVTGLAATARPLRQEQASAKMAPGVDALNRYG